MAPETRILVWQAWSRIPEDEPSPVKRIASQLHLPPADVAAIVYPTPMFGTWDPSQEPDLPGPTNHAQTISRLLFEAREAADMLAALVTAGTGRPAVAELQLVAEIDRYRALRGWSLDGFGGETDTPPGHG